MSIDLILRLSVMVIGALVGWQLAVVFSDWLPPDFPVAKGFIVLFSFFRALSLVLLSLPMSPPYPIAPCGIVCTKSRRVR